MNNFKNIEFKFAWANKAENNENAFRNKTESDDFDW